jgi:hypothetical protein
VNQKSEHRRHFLGDTPYKEECASGERDIGHHCLE